MQFLRCSLNILGPVQTSGTFATAIIPANGADVWSVSASLASGTWTTAVVAVRFGNSPMGPFRDFATPVTLSNASPSTVLLAVQAAYLAVEVTTVEGGASVVDIFVEPRRSDIGNAVAI